MALAVSNLKSVQGLTGATWKTATLTFDASYPTGGYTGVAALLGYPTQILAFVPTQSKGFDYDYLPGTDALKIYQQPGTATAGASPEVPNATNLSAVSIAVLVLGN